MATIAQSAPPMMLVTPLSHSGTLISATPITVTHKPYPTLVSNGGLFGDLRVGSTAKFSPHAATANTMSCHIQGHQLSRESLWVLDVDPQWGQPVAFDTTIPALNAAVTEAVRGQVRIPITRRGKGRKHDTGPPLAVLPRRLVLPEQGTSVRIESEKLSWFPEPAPEVILYG